MSYNKYAYKSAHDRLKFEYDADLEIEDKIENEYEYNIINRTFKLKKEE